MGIFDRVGKGWGLAWASFNIIKKNRNLLLFPVLSTISVLLIIVSFFAGALVFNAGGNLNKLTGLLFLLIFYFVNSAVVIFFNMALIHCTFKILNGEQATVADGIKFSGSKLNLVLSWALVSATVDVILKAIENKHELVTSIVTGLFGMLWSLATFLVMPVMAYENVNITEAIKRSSLLFKNTWGERVGANFSFGIIGFAVFLILALFLGLLVLPFNVPAFIMLVVLLGSIIGCIISASETVFLAAVYQYAAGIPVKGFEQADLGSIFIPKI